MKVWSFITKTHSGYNIYGTLIIIIKKKKLTILNDIHASIILFAIVRLHRSIASVFFKQL